MNKIKSYLVALASVMQALFAAPRLLEARYMARRFKRAMGIMGPYESKWRAMGASPIAGGAFTDREGKIIEQAWGMFQVTLGVITGTTVVPGDLVGPSAATDTYVLADENAPQVANCVAVTGGVEGDTITVAMAVVAAAPPVVTAGVLTAQTFFASTDIGSPLYLSATAGHVSLSEGGTTAQQVGWVLSTSKMLIIPGVSLSGTSLTLSGALSVGTTLAVTGAATLSSTLSALGVITMGTNVKIQFRDTGLYIHSSADGKITLSSDGVSTDDITISGTVTLDDDLITPTTKKIQFRDSGIYINSSADGKMTVSADGTGNDDITLDGSVRTNEGLVLSDVENTVAVSANKTLVIADCGIIQLVDTDAKTVTLPATAAGLNYIIVNNGADGAVLVAISPNAADKISGLLATPVDDKDMLNTKATAKKGDYLQIVADGVDGWVVARSAGTWAREA